MVRWNGWGDENTGMAFPRQGRELLMKWVGEPIPMEDYPLEKLMEKVPESRLPDHVLVKKDAKTRVFHSHGQSLPDWVGMRLGTIERFPDGVAFPTTVSEVGEVMEYALKADAMVIPWGGGTSVAGHLTVPESARPVLTLSLARLNRLVSLDPGANLAVFEAGVAGPDLEAQLSAQGFTLGHYPQSFELSTLGGWIATRSSGQQSMHYGRIEALTAGVEMLTPRGSWTLPPFPASAAGPDLRQVVLGSEGRMGIITRATVRVSAKPEKEAFYGACFPSWHSAADALREIAQKKIPLCMTRLSNHVETVTNMALSGHETQTAILKKYLKIRGIGEEDSCMVLFGVTGTEEMAGAAHAQAASILRRHKGVIIGQAMGKAWEKKRFLIPYLRNTLWDAGYVVDTLETAVTWDRATTTMRNMEGAIREALASENERVHVFTHLSHVYPTGTSVYTSFVFRPGATPSATLARWAKIKKAASEAIVASGGTISHQHGVGMDHAPYLPAEKGRVGMEVLGEIVKFMDPDKRMNPGKLILD